MASAHLNAVATVSIGIATYPDDADSTDALTRAAERALARAVARGGNRTVCASLDDPAAPSGWTVAGASP